MLLTLTFVVEYFRDNDLASNDALHAKVNVSWDLDCFSQKMRIFTIRISNRLLINSASAMVLCKS